MTQPQDAAADAQRLFEQASQAAERGEYEVAAGLYSRLIGNSNPTMHVAGLLGLADSRYRLDDEEGALQSWITATQGPETPLTWRAWVALAGARVRQADLPGAARAYREAERRAPADEQAGIAARLGWLNKEMGNSSTAQRYFGRARGDSLPFATWAVIAVTSAIGLWAILAPGAAEPVVNLFQLDKEAVRNGEYWRLLTVALVHDQRLPIHLLFNMYALYIVGPLVEVLYGRVLFLTFYLLAAAGGSVASYLVFPNPSVGASGAIFGLFGLLFAANYIHKPALGRQAAGMTRQIGMLIVINLVIGFAFGGRIDNAAHIGGLLVGGWLGLIVAPRGTANLASLWQRA
ncbi:MAG: rhomboid family intramembrane serine protease [Candidatus Limnocylindrales bacterium]